MKGAEVVVLSYGITSRVAVKAVQDAKKAGIKVGTLRLRTVWPFPEKRVAELSRKVKAIVVPEINAGQMVREVERSAAGRCRVTSVPHFGGWVHDPKDILKAIKEAAK
jgi:2-oxoglutarate ferredoxin oxidoreductase subunit alpha